MALVHDFLNQHGGSKQGLAIGMTGWRMLNGLSVPDDDEVIIPAGRAGGRGRNEGEEEVTMTRDGPV